MKKRWLVIFTACTLCLGLVFTGFCGSALLQPSAIAAQEAQEATQDTQDTVSAEEIKIVYTNDIHSYIANMVKQQDGSTAKGLRLSNIAQMTEDWRAGGENVLLVDGGDEIQGSTYGSIDQGESVIRIMNAAGYQLATPGNHDFDFGVDQLYRLADEADFPYISCNFCYLGGEDPFADTYIFEIGGCRIAFIGITTPETLTTSTPVYFQDAEGNFIYRIDGTDDPQDLYDSVQEAIDSVRADADYVIALGHTGVGMDEQNNFISSRDIIRNTTGLDAYIDAHSHTTMPGEEVENLDGDKIILTQTGCYLAAAGVMTIHTDGTITTELISSYDGEDETVAALEDELIARVQDQMGEQVAVLDTELYVNNPEDSNQRLIRAQEMNIGDFTADAFYWYFNEVRLLDCDVVLQNSGGIRTGIQAGDVTELDINNVEPFGNQVCLIAATGQQILDALEMGVTVTGEWDAQWNAPAENGAFMQVAGLQYTVDPSVISSVETDADGMFVRVVGEYRVKNVSVYNRETGVYEALDLEKEYTVGGINYILRNSGNGLSMFRDSNTVVDFVGQDSELLSGYLKSFTQQDGYPRINTANSPLAAYQGYQLDYENPFGAGRITILDTGAVTAEEAETAEAAG